MSIIEIKTFCNNSTQKTYDLINQQEQDIFYSMTLYIRKNVTISLYGIRSNKIRPK